MVWYNKECWGATIGGVGKDHFHQNLTCLVKKAGTPIDKGIPKISLFREMAWYIEGIQVMWTLYQDS